LEHTNWLLISLDNKNICCFYKASSAYQQKCDVFFLKDKEEKHTVLKLQKIFRHNNIKLRKSPTSRELNVTQLDQWSTFITFKRKTLIVGMTKIDQHIYECHESAAFDRFVSHTKFSSRSKFAAVANSFFFIKLI
jgi:hypothetical protein